MRVAEPSVLVPAALDRVPGGSSDSAEGIHAVDRVERLTVSLQDLAASSVQD